MTPPVWRAAMVAVVVALGVLAGGCAPDPRPPWEEPYNVGYAFMARSLREDPDPRIPVQVCLTMQARLEAEGRGQDGLDALRGCTAALHDHTSQRTPG